jgi:uncharacterized protein YndB with AHSA1/START domain
MNTSTTDRIEREVFLKAPRKRVWRALTDTSEFGEWFRVGLIGKRFAAGQTVSGPVLHPGYEHITWSVVIEKMEPERVFSWRWQPHAIDPNKDYSKEPTTLVTFELEDRPGGTLLKVIESGFDQVPVERRETAYRGNSEGWTIQMRNIERYVSQSPEP